MVCARGRICICTVSLFCIAQQALAHLIRIGGLEQHNSFNQFNILPIVCVRDVQDRILLTFS